MNSKWKRGSEEGGSLPYLLLLIAVAVVCWYLFTKSRNAQLAEQAESEAVPELLATPEPQTIRPTTPAPITRTAPTPAPIAAATPAPAPSTPVPLDLAMVAATRTLWPVQVGLLQPVAFPIIFNGRVAGEAKVPAGTAMRLLSVQGDKVEVEYQTSKHLIPAASTDLMMRARLAYDKANSAVVNHNAPVPVPDSTPSATPTPTTASVDSRKLAERLTIEVVRMKRSRVEGGDWDDKKDRIELKVKVANGDTALSANLLKAEIFILGESILDRSSVLVLGREKFEFPMPVRGSYEYITPQVVTAYDTTGARFGHKYEGWFLRIVDEKGAIVVEKSNLPTLLKNGDRLFTLGVGQSFDRVTFGQTQTFR